MKLTSITVALLFVVSSDVVANTINVGGGPDVSPTFNDYRRLVDVERRVGSDLVPGVPRGAKRGQTNYSEHTA